MKKLTHKEVLHRFIDCHGDKYDYSNFKFTRMSDKFLCICNTCHHEWMITPANHVRGRNCPECKKEIIGSGFRWTKEKFIEEAMKIHGDKFDYSRVLYVNAKTHVTIGCPLHGWFQQIPHSHLKITENGCSKCGDAQTSNTQKAKNLPNYLKKATEKFKGIFTYNVTDFRTVKCKISITCKKHGTFKTSFSSHLKSTTGCPECSLDSMRVTLEEFIKRSSDIHLNKYGYWRVDYSNNNVHVEIVCPHHGMYSQTPMSHLQGKGCPTCGEGSGGFCKSKPALLYYVRIEQPFNASEYLYKIGITNKSSVKERFSAHDYNMMTVINTWSYESGTECFNEESRLLKLHKGYKYTGVPLLDSNGNTELFTKDILGLDK